jgi:hypothetical protein
LDRFILQQLLHILERTIRFDVTPLAIGPLIELKLSNKPGYSSRNELSSDMLDVLVIALMGALGLNGAGWWVILLGRLG